MLATAEKTPSRIPLIVLSVLCVSLLAALGVTQLLTSFTNVRHEAEINDLTQQVSTLEREAQYAQDHADKDVDTYNNLVDDFNALVRSNKKQREAMRDYLESAKHDETERAALLAEYSASSPERQYQIVRNVLDGADPRAARKTVAIPVSVKPPAPPTTDATPTLTRIQASLDATPPPAAELWSVGPAKNVVRPYPEKDIRHDLRIVKLALYSRNGNTFTIQDAFEIWKKRLGNILQDSELATALHALKLAQADSYMHPLDTQRAEAIGERFRTIASVGRNRIELELNWLNPKDPESIAAKTAQQK